jgi:hypothetical protein
VPQPNVELLRALLPDPGTDVAQLFRDEDWFASIAITRRIVAGRTRSEAPGLYWWVVDLDAPTHAVRDPSFNPLGKPAEAEIQKCFRG